MSRNTMLLAVVHQVTQHLNIFFQDNSRMFKPPTVVNVHHKQTFEDRFQNYDCICQIFIKVLLYRKYDSIIEKFIYGGKKKFIYIFITLKHNSSWFMFFKTLCEFCIIQSVGKDYLGFESKLLSLTSCTVEGKLFNLSVFAPIIFKMDILTVPTTQHFLRTET